MARAPFPLLEHTIFLERHDESDDHFLFQHEAYVGLFIEDYPLEHWNRDHIIHCVAPFANPHFIDPICLTGMDYFTVITSVKAESLADIPHHSNFKNHDSSGSVGRVYVFHIEDIAGPDLDSDSDGSSDGGSGGHPPYNSSRSPQHTLLPTTATIGSFLLAVASCRVRVCSGNTSLVSPRSCPCPCCYWLLPYLCSGK